MKEDFSELVEYLDKRFTGVETEVIGLKTEVSGLRSDFSILQNDVSDLKNDFSDLLTSVDSYAKKADSYFQEMVMLSHKIDRHEKWLHQVAEKLGVKLEY